MKLSARILALSSSRVGGCGYLEQAAPFIDHFLGASPMRIAFIGFAAADGDYDAYAQKVRDGLQHLAHTIEVVLPSNCKNLLHQCDAVMVGGGNTFKLLHHLYQHQLMQLLRDKIYAGTPYIGWSAGSNITGATIKTTNDMPVIEPESFKALGFFPFQINPHYINQVSIGFHGETRDQRLEEFMMLNPGVPVIGLPEGTALLQNEQRLQFVGEVDGVLFRDNTKTTIANGTDLAFYVS